MLAICIRLAAAIHAYLAFYMPTNRAVDWLRSPRGIKWAIPFALVATPAYLFAMSVCMTIIDRGGPGYLNVLVMLFAWNAIKFVALGVLSPVLRVTRRGCRSVSVQKGALSDLPHSMLPHGGDREPSAAAGPSEPETHDRIKTPFHALETRLAGRAVA